MIVLDDMDRYKDWSLQMKTELQHRWLWDIVEGTDEPPKAENDDAAWSKKNAMALKVIRGLCENPFTYAIAKISSAKIAWDTLAGICALPETAFEFLADGGNNYLDWDLKVKAILMDRQLWDIVEGTNDPSKAEKNDMTLGLIEYSCFWFWIGSSYKLGIGKLGSDKLRSITSAKILWEALVAICALPKNNYLVWSLQMKTKLKHEQLWDIVEGNDEPPKAKNDEAAFMAWFKKNAMALEEIQHNCTIWGPFRCAIEKISSAKIAWDTLAAICALPKTGFEFLAHDGNNYLTDRQLWEIVEGADDPSKEEKNDMALGLIRYSCKQSNLGKVIKEFSSAKIAWDTLGAICALHKTDVEFLAYDGNNYLDWSLQVKAILTDRQLWEIVEGADDPSKEEKNGVALQLIRYSCKHSNLDHVISDITSAKRAWDTLEAICALHKTGYEFLATDGNNYLDWSLQVKAILMDRQLWEIVEGADDPSKEEKNDVALRLIQYSCKHPNLDDVIWDITSAQIAWDTLAAICALPKRKLHIAVIGYVDYEVGFERLDFQDFIEYIHSIPVVIKRLDDVGNYKDWSLQVKTYLTDQQLWDIVEGNNEPPKVENGDLAFKAWFKKNDLAFRVIVFSCGYRLRFAIWWITSAKIAWDTLAEICKFRKRSYMEDPEEYDYVFWSVRMEAYLKACDLWDIVEAATEPPKPENDEIAFNAWSKKNAKALYLIWEMSDAFFNFKKSTRTARIAWDTLAGYHNSRGKENNELRKYELFRQCLRDGNWDRANQFITSNPEAKSATISNTGSTALHMVILAGHLQIVKELVNMLPIDKLRMRHKDGNTILGFCALVGNTKMAECIVEKCPILLGIANGLHGLIPVVMALAHNSNTTAMAQYLYSVTPEENLSPTKGVNGATFVTRCIYSRAFDMALKVLEKFPTLVTASDIEESSPVLALASISSAYMSGNHLMFWKRWIYNCIQITRVNDVDQTPASTQKPEHGKCIQVRNIGLGIRQISELKLLPQLLLRMCEQLQDLHGQQLREIRVDEAIIKAAKKGTVEFVTAIWRACPELVWAEEQDTRRNPFMCAVLHRQHEIFRLLYGFVSKDAILAKTDNEGNNILHMAAMTEPSARRNTVPGAAFHMQREVQWFQEVKSIVHPSLIEAKNKSGHTPDYLFANHHKDLVDEAKNWVKETASSCTVPAALIVTIMFAAAITVPGGYNQNTGLPMFLKDTVFMVFILSDVLSLISATTSLLVFLVITSCYTEEDFLISLPKKMILGLSSLIFSIATMMINFCASLFIILDGNLWVVIPIICLATVPVFLFAWKQFHLLLDMFTSTYRPRRIFDRNVKPWS